MVLEQVPYEELRMNQLFQIGRDLYQVSSVHEGYLTAQWVYPLQKRTRVVEIGRDTYQQCGHRASHSLIERYETAWGFEKGSTK
jgi:hypothetical protein